MKQIKKTQMSAKWKFYWAQFVFAQFNTILFIVRSWKYTNFNSKFLVEVMKST